MLRKPTQGDEGDVFTPILESSPIENNLLEKVPENGKSSSPRHPNPNLQRECCFVATDAYEINELSRGQGVISYNSYPQCHPSKINCSLGDRGDQRDPVSVTFSDSATGQQLLKRFCTHRKVSWRKWQ